MSVRTQPTTIEAEVARRKEIDALIKKARNVSLLDVVKDDVKLQEKGPEFWGLCPFHKEKTPSFSVNPDKGVYGCLGCGEGGDVIAYVMWRQRLGFIDAIYYLTSADRPQSSRAPEAISSVSDEADKKRKREAALAIWRESCPAPGTLVETYLVSRSITFPPPPSLRFHPSLKYPYVGRFPAMVAGVQDPDGHTVAIHRTYLRPDGKGKAPVDDPKLALAPNKYCAVRLALAGPKLAIAEGIETALSVQQATGLPTWAVLGTSGMGTVIVPPQAREITVCTDSGEAGERAARKAANRFAREGRVARIAKPRLGDFNDDLVDEI